jgi:hypothetical protein
MKKPVKIDINTNLGYVIRFLLVMPLIICALLACIIVGPLVLLNYWNS